LVKITDGWERALAALEHRALEVATAASGDSDAAVARFCALLRADLSLQELVARWVIEAVAEDVPWHMVLRTVGAHATRENLHEVEKLWRRAYSDHLLRPVEWARAEGPAAWHAMKHRQAAQEADLGGMVRYSVEDRLRKNRSKQPTETAVAEWYLYETYEARGPENSVRRLHECEEKMAKDAKRWREWAACWRGLAVRLCEHHHCRPTQLPPPSARQRPHVSQIEKLRRASQAGEIIAVSDIEYADRWDKLYDFLTRAPEQADTYEAYIYSAIAVPKYLECVAPPKPWNREEERYFIRHMTAKHAALVAGHLVDVADWLERTASVVESQVRRPRLATVPPQRRDPPGDRA
jgi:hypothetical protein